MLISKRTLTLNQKKGYLFFDTDVSIVSIYSGEDEKDMPQAGIGENDGTFNVFTGPVKFFKSLVELNDHLGTFNVNESRSEGKRFLFKGHLFPAKHFPLELKEEYNKILVIEKVDDSSCFTEEVSSLKDAADSIELEANAESLKNPASQKDVIADYLIFVGKAKKIIYRCVDTDSEE